METIKQCIQCKSIKNVEDFERYGRTYRRICRTCRGAVITGVTVATINATVARSETHVQDIISILEAQQEERVRMIESELTLLKRNNQQLITICRSLTEQTGQIQEQLETVIEKLDDVIVRCKDPKVQKAIKAIGNSIAVIHDNTKRSAINSPLSSPATSPQRF